MHCRNRVFVIFITMALWTSMVGAQTSSGTISGVVQDTSGAVVPGVQVTITNVDTGIVRSIESDEAGRYEVRGLIPGPYEIRAQLTGFQTAVRQGLQLNVGSQISIPLTLAVGQATETALVTAEAPIVETNSSTLGALVTGGVVRDLPLNGRSFDQLISLEASAPQFRAYTSNLAIGMANSYIINGAWQISNVYLMDGIELVGGAISSTQPSGVLGKNMGVDAVQEFKVMTGNYSAEYGKRMGGVINIATRTGTNQYHGSAYEFLRNSALDARNFFDITPEPPPFKRNQFGATLGGPIKRDQTFFFFNYEGLRERLALRNIAFVPDDNAREGLLPDPARPGQFTNVGVAPNVRPYLALFPRVNGRNFGDGTGEFIGNPTQPSNQDYYLARIDHAFPPKDSLIVRYNFQSANQLAPQANGFNALYRTSRDQVAMLEQKHIFSPTTLNTLRFGFSRGNSPEKNQQIDGKPYDRSLVFYPGAEAVGNIAFTTLAGGGAAASLTNTGTNILWQRVQVINQFDVNDQIYHRRGAHAFNFGAQYQRIQHNEDFGFYKFGAFSFANLVTFLQGRPATFLSPDPSIGANARRAYRQSFFSTFIQHDYTVRPDFTLNLGLRYELMTVPTEAYNRISNYRPVIVNGVSQLESKPTLGGPFYKGSHNLFAPRVGFAWNVFGDGKTAVRGGFGVFYDQIEIAFREWTANNPPFFATVQINNPPFPLGFSNGATAAGVPAVDGIDPELQTPTRFQWSLNIQRSITTNAAFTIGYVGAHSSHLTRVSDWNQAIPQIQSDGRLFFPPGAQPRNPNLGRSQLVVSDGNAIYHALNVDFTQRLSRGLRSKVSFTYSKNIDDVSNIDTAFAPGNTYTPLIPTNTRAERGLSAYDLRRNLVMNFTYDLPFGRFSGAPGKLLGGWQLGAIATLSDGTPFTGLVGFNRARNQARNNGDRPNLKPGRSNNPVLGGPDRYFDPTAFELPEAGYHGNLGRNTLIGPGFATVDGNLQKSITLKEGVRADFRFEVFNILNHANFRLPVNSIFNADGTIRPTAGRITSTSTTARQLQLGIKLTF